MFLRYLNSKIHCVKLRCRQSTCTDVEVRTSCLPCTVWRVLYRGFHPRGGSLRPPQHPLHISRMRAQCLLPSAPGAERVDGVHPALQGFAFGLCGQIIAPFGFDDEVCAS